MRSIWQPVNFVILNECKESRFRGTWDISHAFDMTTLSQHLYYCLYIINKVRARGRSVGKMTKWHCQEATQHCKSVKNTAIKKKVITFCQKIRKSTFFVKLLIFEQIAFYIVNYNSILSKILQISINCTKCEKWAKYQQNSGFC